MNIICIIVTYNPQLSILYKSLNSLLKQTDGVIIVDNSDHYINFSSINGNVEIIRNGRNLGIAKAQNIGIDYALSQGADFVLFMDQDSLISDNFVKSLMRCYNQKSKEELIGAVGPMPFNRENNLVYYAANIDNSKKSIAKVDTLISSGSLVPKEILILVGGMDDSLFIDMVDLEWCWRATYKTNCSFYIDTQCLLSHSLGQMEVQFLRKRIPLHSPNRMFYRFRNYFLLLPRGYVPCMWKLRYPFSNLIRLFLCLCLFSNKKAYWSFALKGVKEGFCFLFKLKK